MSTEVRIPRLLTTKELADATGLPVWTLWELVKKGEGPPHVRLGKGFRFPESGVGPWLERLLTKQSENGDSEP